MGIGTQVQAAVEKTLRNAGRIHGSAFRDLLIEAGYGYVDTGLVELIIDRLGLTAEADFPDPTPSQRAFFGLQCLKAHPGFIPGTKEHFWLARRAPESEPAPAAPSRPAIPKMRLWYAYGGNEWDLLGTYSSRELAVEALRSSGRSRARLLGESLEELAF